MQSLRKTCISQLSSCQPPGFQQQEQLYDVHLTSMHFFMPFISVCPEATHNMHPWGEKKYPPASTPDSTILTILLSSFPLLCKVRYLTATEITSYQTVL